MCSLDIYIYDESVVDACSVHLMLAGGLELCINVSCLLGIQLYSVPVKYSISNLYYYQDRKSVV